MKAPAGSRRPPDRKPDLEIFPALDRAWPADGLGSVATLLAQLPDPAGLDAGALVFVHEGAAPARGIRRVWAWVRRSWNKPKKAHPAARCTALLARGLREIGVAADPRTGEAIVFGWVPTSGRFSSEP